MMGINEKREKNLKRQFFLEIANYSSFLKQCILSNKMPGTSTAADSSFASAIRPKRPVRQVHLSLLCLYNNAATIYFLITRSMHTLQPTNKYTL